MDKRTNVSGSVYTIGPQPQPSAATAALDSSASLAVIEEVLSFNSPIERRAQEEQLLAALDANSLSMVMRSGERVALTDRRGRTARGSSR